MQFAAKPRTRFTFAYALLVVVPVLGVLAALQYGAEHVVPHAGQPVPARAATVGPTLRLPVLLMQAIVILVASRLLGLVVRRLRQPQVIGEMLAGILLGPSLLGAVAPSIYTLL